MKDQIDDRPARLTVRGKPKRFFDAQGVDELTSMVLALSSELWVVKEEIAQLKSFAAKSGAMDMGALEAHELSPEEAATLTTERDAFIKRVLFVLQEQLEAEIGEEGERPEVDPEFGKG